MQIDAKLRAELQEVIAATKPGFNKKLRLFNKAVGYDVKFNKWLASNPETGFGRITDEKIRERVFEALTTHGWTSVKEKQAILISLLETELDNIVKEKDAEVTRGLVLNDKEKEMHAKQLIRYRKYVNDSIIPGLMQYGLALGVVSPVPAEQPVPAE